MAFTWPTFPPPQLLTLSNTFTSFLIVNGSTVRHDLKRLLGEPQKEIAALKKDIVDLAEEKERLSLLYNREVARMRKMLQSPYILDLHRDPRRKKIDDVKIENRPIAGKRSEVNS